jgi:hypothetical protein
MRDTAKRNRCRTSGQRRQSDHGRRLFDGIIQCEYKPRRACARYQIRLANCGTVDHLMAGCLTTPPLPSQSECLYPAVQKTVSSYRQLRDRAVSRIEPRDDWIERHRREAMNLKRSRIDPDAAKYSCLIGNIAKGRNTVYVISGA